MRIDFHSNGHIKDPLNLREIEFWGPEAGEYEVIKEGENVQVERVGEGERREVDGEIE